MRRLLAGALCALVFGCGNVEKASSNAGHSSGDSAGTGSGSTGGTGGTGGTTGSGGVEGPGGSTASGGSASGGDMSGGAAPGTGGGGASSGNGDGQVPAGVLTAGAWDDNLNFDFYGGYLEKEATANLLGMPQIPRADRLVVTVTDSAGQPVAGATVTASHAGKAFFSTTTGADGRVLLFPAWAGLSAGDSLDLAATENGAEAHVTASAGEPAAALTLTASAAVTALDIAFVIDVTGSMGDELAYIKAEADAISKDIAAAYPNVSQRWGLVVYRDANCDAFVEQHADFRDVAGFQAALAPYTADGGCDYPESPEVALEAASQLSWRTGPTARLVFHVADAPHHPGREGALVNALADLRTKGVHVYPVQASGADELTEFSMRTEAEVTGGSFLFLTDDSGIGDSHEEPLLPCYLVTRLNQAITRMVAMELTGQHLYPSADQVIRTGGNPQDNRCQLPDGHVVSVF